MEYQFKFPEIEKGFFKITNFPYAFKHSNYEIYMFIEFAHVTKILEGGHYVEKIHSYFYREHNIECTIFLKIGDKFDRYSKKIINQNIYKQTFWLDNYERISFNKFADNPDLEFSIKSSDTQYYSVLKKSKNKEITIIIPSIVIGQAFYLVNSLIIKNLFRASIEELTDIVDWRSREEENLMIGEISLKKHGSDEIKSMAKALAFFLFSKNDYLWQNLLNTQSDLYHQLLKTPQEINFNFKVPIKEKLQLSVNGNYLNVRDKTYFVANEIIKVESAHQFSDLYITDYTAFIDYYNPESASDERTGGSGKKRKKKSTKNKNTTSTDEGVNTELASNFVENGIDLLSSIVSISTDYKESAKTSAGGKPLFPKISKYGTFNSKQPDPNSKSGGTSGGKSPAGNDNEEEEVFFMLNSIQEKLKSIFNITKCEINNTEMVMLKVSDKFGNHAILIDDIYHTRLRIIYYSSLKDFKSDNIKSLVDDIANNEYDWNVLRDLKNSDGRIIGQPTNYNINGTRMEKSTKKKNISKKKTKVSDLCYLNIKKKLEDLFSQNNN